MNFEFSEDQNLLREQARGFLQDNCPTTVVRKVLDANAGHDAGLWRKVVDMGWTATVIPEEFGGLGLGYLELCVIAEELGRACAPIPFSSSVYLATEALLLAGSQAQKERWLSKLAAGEAIGTFAMSEGAGRASPKSLTTSVAGGKITGTKVPVPDVGIAQLAIVLARHAGGDGAALYLVDLGQDGVSITPVPTLDPTRGHGELTLAGVACEPLGKPGEGWALTRKLLDRAAVLFAWEQVGGSEAALEEAAICARSLCVRPADRVLPGDQTQAREHVREKHAGALQLLLRGLGAQYRRAGTAGRRGHRAGVGDAGLLLRVEGKHPDPRRHGVHVGIRLPVLLPARQAAVGQSSAARDSGRTN